MTERSEGAPTFEELDALPTQELKDRAFDVARRRGDVRFLWEVVGHLPQTAEFAAEDGASGGMLTTVSDLVAGFEEVFGQQMANVGPLEPLLRARFVDYLLHH